MDNDMENEEDQNMEEGCGKPCTYCHLLEKSQGKTFKSKSNKKVFKIRQRITCKSRNIFIYLVTCAKCKLQVVGHSTQFGKRISNYFSHIKNGTCDCEISCHLRLSPRYLDNQIIATTLIFS